MDVKEIQNPYSLRLTSEGEQFAFELIKTALWKQYITSDDKFNYRLEIRSLRKFKDEFNLTYLPQREELPDNKSYLQTFNTIAPKKELQSVDEIYDLVNQIVKELMEFYDVENKSQDGYLTLYPSDVGMNINNNHNSLLNNVAKNVTTKDPDLIDSHKLFSKVMVSNGKCCT